MVTRDGKPVIAFGVADGERERTNRKAAKAAKT